MQFELTKERIDKLQELIGQNDKEQIEKILDDLHPADIAEVMVNLDMDEAKYIYLLLDGDKGSDVLLEIPENDRVRFLAALPPEVIARQYIEHMDTDDAADVLGELPDSVKDQIISFIDDTEHADEIVNLLTYDEDTAGGIMAVELVAVQENWTVQRCLREISIQSENVDEIYYVYVIDENEELKGILSLKKLIQYPTQTPISKIYNREVISIGTEASREEVAQVMSKYDLVALPVVDKHKKLQGRITIDDVVDIIREEAEKDYQMAVGITGDVAMQSKILSQTKARLPWLALGFIGEILASRVLGSHESNFTLIPGIAFFMPLIIAMGGNVGVQSTSIALQKLSGHTKDMDSVFHKVLKELSVALIMSLIFSLLLWGYNYFAGGSPVLTYTVSTALFLVILFAALTGTLIPLLLDKVGVDPAMATGPFITTTNDILGLMIYMYIGQLYSNWFGI